MTDVTASKVLYVKLGKGNSYAEECKSKDILKLAFNEVSHDDCLSRNWENVRKYYTKVEKRLPRVASDFIRQLELFYCSDEDTIWITFWKDEMWWSKASKDVVLELGSFKHRRIINSWRNEDVLGNILTFNKLSGNIKKKYRYGQTICAFDSLDSQYILDVINGKRA